MEVKDMVYTGNKGKRSQLGGVSGRSGKSGREDWTTTDAIGLIGIDNAPEKVQEQIRTVAQGGNRGDWWLTNPMGGASVTRAGGQVKPSVPVYVPGGLSEDQRKKVAESFVPSYRGYRLVEVQPAQDTYQGIGPRWWPVAPETTLADGIGFDPNQIFTVSQTHPYPIVYSKPPSSTTTTGGGGGRTWWGGGGGGGGYTGGTPYYQYPDWATLLLTLNANR